MHDLDRPLRKLQETIGTEYPVQGWNVSVTPESVRHFAHGMGDDNPLWTEGRCVPPAYLYSCSSAGRHPSAEHVSPATLLVGYSALWKGDRWMFAEPVRVGRQVHTTVVLTRAEVRDSHRRGTVVDLEETFRFRDDSGDLIAECAKQTMRFRRAGSGFDSMARGVENNGGRDTGAEVGAPQPSPVPTYSDTELDAIAAESLGEKIRGAEARHADDVRVGDDLGSLIKGPLTVTGILAWVLGWGSPLVLTDRQAHRYWSVSPESRLINGDGLPDTAEAAHWDGELARRVGMPRGYDFGAQRIAWLSQLLTDWCGDHGSVVSLDAKLLAPNLIGDLTRISGTVIEIHGATVQCLVEAHNQRGEQTAAAVATVRLPDRWISSGDR